MGMMTKYTTADVVYYTIDLVNKGVAKLRELSPVWDLYQDGVDLKCVLWVAH